jgi:hypothetical protein
VYYERKVRDEPVFGTSSYEVFPPENQYLIYLHSLLEPAHPVQLGSSRLTGKRDATLEWRGADDLRQQVVLLRQEITDRYRALVAALVSSGRLTPAEAARFATPAIEVNLIDKRTDRSVLLPDVSRLQ